MLVEHDLQLGRNQERAYVIQEVCVRVHSCLLVYMCTSSGAQCRVCVGVYVRVCVCVCVRVFAKPMRSHTQVMRSHLIRNHFAFFYISYS